MTITGELWPAFHFCAQVLYVVTPPVDKGIEETIPPSGSGGFRETLTPLGGDGIGGTVTPPGHICVGELLEFSLPSFGHHFLKRYNFWTGDFDRLVCTYYVP